MSAEHNIGHFAGAIDAWQRRVYDPCELTPQKRTHRAHEEVYELDEALRTGHNEKILGESCDVIIGMFGAALTVAQPQEVAATLFGTLVNMLRKYDSSEVLKLKAEGMSTDQALAHRKELWVPTTLYVNPSRTQ
jgi:hypothetical protein